MFFWLLLALGFVIVAVAIALPVGLAVGCKHSLNPQSGSRNSSSPLSTAEVSFNSSLAAIAFNHIQDLVHYRIYYQDNNGAIKESSWNSSGQSWYVSNAAIGLEKSKSPLAPLVTGPQQHPCVSIYYIFLAAFCANAWVACSKSMSMLLVVLVNSFPGHPRTQIGQVAALLLLLALSVKKAFSQRQTRIWLRIGTVHQAAPNVPIHSIFLPATEWRTSMGEPHGWDLDMVSSASWFHIGIESRY